MDVEKLSSLLPETGGAVTIAGDWLAETPIADWLGAWQGTPEIALTHAAKRRDEASLLVTGTAARFMGVVDVPFTAEFSFDAEGAMIVLMRGVMRGATLPREWTFRSCFTDFVDEQAGEAGRLESLAWSSAELVLTTAPATDPAHGVPLRPGLNFIGTVPSAALIGPLAKLPDAPAECTVYGACVPAAGAAPVGPLPATKRPWEQQGAPGFHLRADLPLGFKLGDTVALSGTAWRGYFAPSRAWAEANRTYRPRSGYSTTLAFPGAGISAELSGALSASGALSLSAMLEGLSVAHIGELTGITGELPALPEPLERAAAAAGAIELRSLGLLLNAEHKLAQLTCGISLPGVDLLPGFELSRVGANFGVWEPLSENRQVSVELEATATFGGVPLDAIVSVLPHVSLSATIPPGTSVPLNAWCGEIGLPGVADLMVDEADVEADADGNVKVSARLATGKPWTLDLGPTGTKVHNVVVQLQRSNGATTGWLAGSLEIGPLALDARLDLSGDFRVDATLEEVHLSDVLVPLTGGSLPDWLDFTVPTSRLLIDRRDGACMAGLAMDLGEFGDCAAMVLDANGSWGFVVAVALETADLGRFPALAPVSAVTGFLGLQELVLVLSDVQRDGFSIPEELLAGAGNKLAPLGRNLPDGLSLAARLSMGQGGAFQALADFLDIKLDGSVGVAVHVPLEDPSNGTEAAIVFDSRVDDDTTIAGKFGARLDAGVPELFLEGHLNTVLDGQPLTFDAGAVVTANSVLVSGSLRGQGVHLDCLGMQILDLAVLLGINFEGVPSFGLVGTLGSDTINGSVAVLFDSTEPGRFLAGGAISDVTLLDAVEAFAGSFDAPPEVTDVLRGVSVKGRSLTALPPDAADALNRGETGPVIEAFAAVSEPLGASRDLILHTLASGEVWHLTDHERVVHYDLRRVGDRIEVNKQAQFYCAPQAVSIGQRQFPAGVRMNADLNFFGIHANVDVDVAQDGICLEGSVEPITLISPSFLALTDATGQSGPSLSIATMARPNHPDEAKRRPHVLLSGRARVLGRDVSSVDLKAYEDYLFFRFSQDNGFIASDLQCEIGNGRGFVSGSLQVGVDEHLDLGPLGTLHLEAQVHGRLEAGYRDDVLHAALTGGFGFLGLEIELPELSLDVKVADLEALGETIKQAAMDAATDAVNGGFEVCMKALADGALVVVGGLTAAATAVADAFDVGAQEVLKGLVDAGCAVDEAANAVADAFQLGAGELTKGLIAAGCTVEEAAQVVADTLEVGAEEVVKGLVQAGYAAEQAARVVADTLHAGADEVLKGLVDAGYAADQAVDAVKNTGTWTLDQVAGAAQAVADTLSSFGNAAADELNNIANDLSNTASAATKEVEQVFEDAGSWIRSLF